MFSTGSSGQRPSHSQPSAVWSTMPRLHTPQILSAFRAGVSRSGRLEEDWVQPDCREADVQHGNADAAPAASGGIDSPGDCRPDAGCAGPRWRGPRRNSPLARGEVGCGYRDGSGGTDAGDPCGCCGAVRHTGTGCRRGDSRPDSGPNWKGESDVPSFRTLRAVPGVRRSAPTTRYAPPAPSTSLSQTCFQDTVLTTPCTVGNTVKGWKDASGKFINFMSRRALTTDLTPQQGRGRQVLPGVSAAGRTTSHGHKSERPL